MQFVVVGLTHQGHSPRNEAGTPVAACNAWQAAITEACLTDPHPIGRKADR